MTPQLHQLCPCGPTLSAHAFNHMFTQKGSQPHPPRWRELWVRQDAEALCLRLRPWVRRCFFSFFFETEAEGASPFSSSSKRSFITWSASSSCYWLDFSGIRTSGCFLACRIIVISLIVISSPSCFVLQVRISAVMLTWTSVSSTCSSVPMRCVPFLWLKVDVTVRCNKLLRHRGMIILVHEVEKIEVTVHCKDPFRHWHMPFTRRNVEYRGLLSFDFFLRKVSQPFITVSQEIENTKISIRKSTFVCS